MGYAKPPCESESERENENKSCVLRPAKRESRFIDGGHWAGTTGKTEEEICGMGYANPPVVDDTGMLLTRYRVQSSGFGVQGSVCRVQGSGCRVQCSGFRVQVSGLRVQGSGFGVQGFKGQHTLSEAWTCRTQSRHCSTVGWNGACFQGSRFRVQGSGCRVQGSGFRVQGPGFRV